MSVETAKEFIIKVQTDEGLRSEVIGLGQDYDGLIQLAGKRGYTFTADDLKAAVQANGYNIGQTISEENLAAISGGMPHANDGSSPTTWTSSGCC